MNQIIPSSSSSFSASASSTFPESKYNFNMPGIVEDLFLVLTSKEKEVIIKRFSLNNKGKQTLEKIGKQFNVTRERIRQIEKIAINKLRRTIDNTQLKAVNELAKKTIRAHGSLLKEENIINEVLQQLQETTPVDKYIILLSMHIDPEIQKSEKSNELYDYWFLSQENKDLIKKILSTAHALLEKNKDVIAATTLIEEIKKEFASSSIETANEIIQSILEIDKMLKTTKNGIGLAVWRHINPKSIRDKAYIVLKESQKPLHFIEIANRISEVGFDKKVVTTQAVHNELIRCNHFVLVGRGLYALKEWGYKEGTVSEIIEMLLKKKSPLTKKQIIKGVLKQRKVKKGTISLNLQKNPDFIRVGRAVYALKK